MWDFAFVRGGDTKVEDEKVWRCKSMLLGSRVCNNPAAWGGKELHWITMHNRSSWSSCTCILGGIWNHFKRIVQQQVVVYLLDVLERKQQIKFNSWLKDDIPRVDFLEAKNLHKSHVNFKGVWERIPCKRVLLQIADLVFAHCESIVFVSFMLEILMCVISVDFNVMGKLWIATN